MFNADMPTRAELPSTRQLIRSTLIALAAAIAILVTIVLPAEYGVDPTGVGRVLGLAEMGEIKTQLAAEAAADRLMDEQRSGPQSNAAPALLDGLLALLVGRPAAAQTAAVERSDEMSLTLAPGEGAEIKLVMTKGARVAFTWSVEGGVANFDLHGDGGGQSISYEKGRGVPGQAGEFEAAFDGNHGWFWRNRGREDVTITLRTSGAYSDIARVI
jgi:hypothetical protein